MEVREIMTRNVASCSPDTTLQEVAKTMAERDCGEIPVLDEQGKPLGVVTDRDITCRAVAQGKDPRQTKARDVMSRPVVTCSQRSSVEDCCDRMEQHRIRRVLVVDENGRCCGIVAQADIVGVLPEQQSAHFLHEVSRPASDGSGIARA